MGADETRVTNFKQVNNRLEVSAEAWLVQISGPELGKKYVIENPEGGGEFIKVAPRRVPRSIKSIPRPAS